MLVGVASGGGGGDDDGANNQAVRRGKKNSKEMHHPHVLVTYHQAKWDGRGSFYFEQGQFSGHWARVELDIFFSIINNCSKNIWAKLVYSEIALLIPQMQDKFL